MSFAAQLTSHLSRRLFTFGAMALALATAACGDSEPDQRKAFIKFLNNINERSGVHFEMPIADERVSFGDYMDHYTVILDFNKDLKVLSADYMEGLKKLGIANAQPQTLEQMAARRQTFPAMKELTTNTIQGFEARLAKANAARSALKQPDDLKAVYNKTFDKLITAPVQAMIASDKALLVVLDSSTQIADYINANRSKIAFSGAQVRASDAKTQAELNALIKSHQEAMKRFQDVKRAGDRLVSGS